MSYDSDLASALVAAIGEMSDPAMTGLNPHFHNKYATLKDCLDKVRPVLAAHGLMLTQSVIAGGDGNDRLVTRVMHKTGQFIEDEGIALVGADNMQKYGSAVTYARRYGLCNLLGIVGDPDDDAEIASAPDKKQAAKPAQVVQLNPPTAPAKPKLDLESWAVDAAENLSRIRNTAELKSWSSLNKSTLDHLETALPDTHHGLLTIFNKRKRELNNNA
jgi:hypothetical protein